MEPEKKKILKWVIIIVCILIISGVFFVVKLPEGPFETKTIKVAGLFSSYKTTDRFNSETTEEVVSCRIGENWYNIRGFSTVERNDLLGKYVEFTLSQSWYGSVDYLCTLIDAKVIFAG